MYFLYINGLVRIWYLYFVMIVAIIVHIIPQVKALSFAVSTFRAFIMSIWYNIRFDDNIDMSLRKKSNIYHDMPNVIIQLNSYVAYPHELMLFFIGTEIAAQWCIYVIIFLWGSKEKNSLTRAIFHCRPVEYTNLYRICRQLNSRTLIINTNSMNEFICPISNSSSYLIIYYKNVSLFVINVIIFFYFFQFYIYKAVLWCKTLVQTFYVDVKLTK